MKLSWKRAVVNQSIPYDVIHIKSCRSCCLFLVPFYYYFCCSYYYRVVEGHDLCSCCLVCVCRTVVKKCIWNTHTHTDTFETLPTLLKMGFCVSCCCSTLWPFSFFSFSMLHVRLCSLFYAFTFGLLPRVLVLIYLTLSENMHYQN